MRPARNSIIELRRAIDQLPVATRTAMLEGMRGRNIIVGAYTDSSGGICPMLAAHRNGARTTLLAFARSWDSFAGSRRVRSASRREVAVLESQLTQSLFADSEAHDLGAVIADHVALMDRHTAVPAEPTAKPAEPTAEPAQPKAEPAEQIRATRLTPGRVALLRPRRADADAERALARLDEHVLAATQ